MATGQELLDKLGRKRERILILLYRESEATTSTIREECDIPRGSKEYHFQILEEDFGLIERAGTVPGGGGIPERVWRLTDDGLSFVDEHLAEAGNRPEDHDLRLDRLESRVDDLHEEQERLDDRVDSGFGLIKEKFGDIPGDLERIERTAATEDDLQSLRDDHESMGDTVIEKFGELRESTNERVSELQEENEQLRERVGELESTLAEIEERLDEAEEKGKGGVFSRL